MTNLTAKGEVLCFVNCISIIILLTPSLVSAQTQNSESKKRTIEDIKRDPARRTDIGAGGAALLNRIKAYNGTCVDQPDGILGLGPIHPSRMRHQAQA